MTRSQSKRQNFDVTPEQEAEIAALRVALGVSSAKDTLLRAVRIASILARETSEGRSLCLRTSDGKVERLVIPELERPDGGLNYLVQREHPWRRQVSVKGRRVLASTVWRDMIANRQTPAEAAKEWSMPVEAVEEAVRWCESHRSLVEMEADEERRRLAAAGLGLAPSR